jgi:hypothetical protein
MRAATLLVMSAAEIERLVAEADAELDELLAGIEADGELLLANAEQLAEAMRLSLARRPRSQQARPPRACAVCGGPFEAMRSDACYCGARCRKRASRARLPRWRHPAG